MTTLWIFLAGILGTLAPTFGSSGTFREEFHQSYALSAQGRVALENIHGDVRIAVWDRHEVKVDAIKQADSQERLDEARIVVDAGQNVITIRTLYPAHGNSSHPATVDYVVTVPRAANLDDVKLVNGGLAISGVAGEVRASSVNGGIKAENLAGDARLSTVNGKLEAVFDHVDGSKSITMHSVNGPIMLALPPDARADFRADTVSGIISNDFGLPVGGRLIGRHLNAALKGGGAHIRLNNVNGRITIVPVWRGRRVKFT